MLGGHTCVWSFLFKSSLDILEVFFMGTGQDMADLEPGSILYHPPILPVMVGTHRAPGKHLGIPCLFVTLQTLCFPSSFFFILLLNYQVFARAPCCFISYHRGLVTTAYYLSCLMDPREFVNLRFLLSFYLCYLKHFIIYAIMRFPITCLLCTTHADNQTRLRYLGITTWSN